MEPIQPLQRALVAGQLSRRDFIRRAVALGLSAPAIGAALAACRTAAPTPTTAPPTVVPVGRGAGGVLKLIQWQAPSILNPHLSPGMKDDLVCSLVYEGLIRIDQEGNFIPFLAETIPSVQNGLLADDGRSVTWKLKSDLKWSDGRPVTAADCVTTWEYVVDPRTAATTLALFENVAKVEAVDSLTVRHTFTEPKPDWYRPAEAQILPKHIFEKDKGDPARTSANNLKPIGTGPYRVVEFKPGDTVSYAINDHYREATKPFFATVEVKGGGDAQSAARAVLQTGEFDYAWNLQVEDAVLKQLETGGKGVAEFHSGGGIECNFLNFTDPNKEVDGERSSLNSRHPFLTELKVRQALALAADRKTLVETLYGRIGAVGSNVLDDPPLYRSPNTRPEYSLERANALLDEAGWKRGADGIREKGGVRMNVVYLSTINSVRQKTQQVVKDGWEKIGVKVESRAVDSTIFFSTDVGNPDTSGKMYVDVQLYAVNPAIDPGAMMKRWTTTNARLTQKAGKWSGGNDGRYSNPEYDRLWEAAKTELDPARRAQLFIQMNDILVSDCALIALVGRKNTFARATTLKNASYSQWAGNYWNIANWTK
ncbi:MAG: peptide ABC transporter substrate-binding protein [Chloroflexia bacterium]